MMSIKFGIMQGRLTKTRNNILQKFPKNWQEEFKYLKKTKLDYIEFFTEKKINKKNPFWSNKNFNDIKKNVSQIKYKKIILCDNYTVENLIIEKKTEQYLINLIDRLSFFKGSKLIIPIVSKKLFLEKIFNKHIILISRLINHSKNKKVNLSFEIDANIKIIKKFCKKFSNNKGFAITFDTGNAFLFNKNFYTEVNSIKNFINHIHLKDRDSLGNNVVLGQGKIKFDIFFKNLNTPKNYNGTITFETNRGDNPIRTANSNYTIIRNLLS